MTIFLALLAGMLIAGIVAWLIAPDEPPSARSYYRGELDQ